MEEITMDEVIKTESEKPRTTGIDRRDLLKIGAGVGIAAALGNMMDPESAEA